MFSNDSLVEKMKSFDVYRKLPKNYLQPTFVGAVLSVISVTVMVMLLMSELSAYSQVKTSSEMLVDLSRNSEMLKINLDITLSRLPCSIISLDVQDVMGTHSLNIKGTLTKNKLDKDGNILSVQVEKKSDSDSGHGHGSQPDYEDVKRAVTENEGCRLVGNIEVLRVPGNFHISSHAYGHIISRLFQEGIYKFDVSHKINHISFGVESDIILIKKNFSVGILNPLDGIGKRQDKDNTVYEYYLKVVPTTFSDIDGNNFHVHQFTANQNETGTSMMIPTIFFRYDISPVLVKFVQYKQEFFHFFIQICAIIGGIFTVTGIVDSLLYRLYRKEKE